MFVRVTGGMSRVVGGLNAVRGGACGTSPVRATGGCSSVEMAFWLVSRMVLSRLLCRLKASKLPPIELVRIEFTETTLALLPRRGWYRLLVLVLVRRLDSGGNG